MTSIQIGHLLRSATAGFSVGCSVSQLEVPALGALARAPLEKGCAVYGLITDIHIDDDGLVRQLVTAGDVDAATVADSRVNRIVPVEMSVLAVGYQQDREISYLLPPRPPLSLDVVYLCSDAELKAFVTAGAGPERSRRGFGYFRHVLRAKEIPIGEVLAAHIQEVRRKTKDEGWVQAAIQELITLLRDDYPTLMAVLGALGEVV
jgi:hypothetical protein